MRSNSQWFVMWLLFCVVVFGSACGGDDDDDSGGNASDDDADDDDSADDTTDDDLDDDSGGDDDTGVDDDNNDDTVDDDSDDDSVGDDDATEYVQLKFFHYMLGYESCTMNISDGPFFSNPGFLECSGCKSIAAGLHSVSITCDSETYHDDSVDLNINEGDEWQISITNQLTYPLVNIVTYTKPCGQCS